MAKSIGLKGYHSIEFFVKDLERAVEWHRTKFDFPVVAKSTKDFEKCHGCRSVVLKGAGDVGWIFTTPLEPGSTAGRHLASHPEGCLFLNFAVHDLDKTVEFLAEREAPFLYEIESVKSANGSWRETAIATPIGDSNFRFIETRNFDKFAPGFEWVADWNKVGGNKYKFGELDHVTVNGRCMIGITEFYRHCLGFERYWGIEFHTSHHNKSAGTGSGLESIVMWDPESKIKFATNQPLAPYFNNSQIEIYVEDYGEAGIQHVALLVPEILPVVESLRSDGCLFLDAGKKYYDQLPGRMKEVKLSKINEPMDRVQKNDILVDGHDEKYLLQIFMKEQSFQLKDKNAGPFFYEIIQRVGDEGFGGGNFKALFDSIEQEQVSLNRQEMRDRIDSLV